MSSMRTTGCGAKGTPAVAVAGGGVCRPSRIAEPGCTVIGELVSADLESSVRALAVTERLPAVLRVTLNEPVPANSAALTGRLACASLEVIPTVSVTVLTRFQFASTALTVTLKAVPASLAEGVPVLPLTVPGAAVSPGTRICNLANGPGLTVIDELAPGVFPLSTASPAVTVWIPAVANVTLKVWVPPLNAAAAGSSAPLSLEERETVSVTVPTRFHNESTALTVTVNAAPAVCTLIAPVLPLDVPGALLSPGANTCNFEKAAGLTSMSVDVVLVKLPLVKAMVMLFATTWERSVNVASPPATVRLVVPCNVPTPPARAAVTTVLLSELRRLPYGSSTRRTGCWAKATPAVAVNDGCV